MTRKTIRRAKLLGWVTLLPAVIGVAATLAVALMTFGSDRQRISAGEKHDAIQDTLIQANREADQAIMREQARQGTDLKWIRAALEANGITPKH